PVVEQEEENPDRYSPSASQNRGKDPLADWKTFIIEGLDEGEALWAYISEGKNPAILEQVQPINLYNHSKKIHYLLYKVLSEESYDNNSLWDYFHGILKPLYRELKRWSAQRDLSYTVYDPIFLRLLDVLFLMFNKIPFPEKVKQLVTGDFEICEAEEFESRYRTDWFSQLESLLGEFGSRRDNISRKYIDGVWEIISTHRVEAVELLPEKLFSLEEKELSTEEKIKRRYFTTDLMIVAAIVAFRDQERGHSDGLTESALLYLDHKNELALWNDLSGDLDIPERYIIKIIESGEANHLPQHTIDDYHQKKGDLKLLDQYVLNRGIVTVEGEELSRKASEKIIKKILLNLIEYEEEQEISAAQKSINWLRGFGENTQKLLYVAHMAQRIEGLENRVHSDFLLRFAFEIAPVRTTHMLAKAYRREPYRIDTPEKIFETLNRCVPQGLSQEGYWAYFLHEFQDNYGHCDRAFYKELLQEWIHSDEPVTGNGPTADEQREKREALKKGYELISRRAQQNILCHASELHPQVDLTEKFDRALLGAMERKLQERFAIHDGGERFKNRLKFENIPLEFIDWTDWHTVPELTDQVLHHWEGEQPPGVTPENCEEKLFEKNYWGYIIVQRQKDKMVPLAGKDLIWMIRHCCSEEEMNRAQTYGIVVDQSCPRENLDELMQICLQPDYKERALNQSMAFLKGEIPYSEAALLFKHGIRDYNFIDRNLRTNYFDTDIQEILPHVSGDLQKGLFRMFALISHRALGNLADALDLDRIKFEELLLRYDVDRQSLFHYFVETGQINAIQRLARQIDLSAFLPALKIEELLTVLSLLAPLPFYHYPILSHRNHKSAKVKKQAKKLIEKYAITGLSHEAYRMADFGVYNMQGDTTPQSGATTRTAREPVCIDQTAKIKAELGLFFGFRFTAEDRENHEVLHHHVVVKHPVLNEVRKRDRQISQWPQNGYANSKIFLGWNFETPDELIPGEYRFEAYDRDWKLIAQKSFTVVSQGLLT
ncbi:MAG: DUF3859 domain-containing protein, partial [Spirochaetales bacterium]|nr:DUF3859 domain-containing protein [Spirochaetales bacterium]